MQQSAYIHYFNCSGYDDTCDLSAVLGILANASSFNALVQSNAKDVRSEIRNEWGHCNFGSWDAAKFSRCFQLMETLVRCVGLTPAEEKLVLDGLKDWETRGKLASTGQTGNTFFSQVLNPDMHDSRKPRLPKSF